MSNEVASQQISTRIDQKLSRNSERCSNPFIFKIDTTLRMTYEAAYEPKMVSIGPYHRGKKNLQKMEKYKWEYLQKILERKGEKSAKRYIDYLIQNEETARSYYAEQLKLSKEEFVEMMLLDGCFIVEFLRKYEGRNDDHGNDPIFKMKWILGILRRDFLLFENQIPFFILLKLFEMTSENCQEKSLSSLAISCLNDCIMVVDTTDSKSSHPSKEPQNPFHLLSLMYESWCSSFVDGHGDHGQSSCGWELKQDRIEFIKSVSELKKDGIEFVKSKQSKSWLDIKFKNGEIIIPPLVIHDGTESILRNLIAYEYYMFDSGFSWNILTNYTTLMDCLINTPMDVQELRVKGIIKNWLGDDKEITDMFNTMGNHVFHSPQHFKYREIFNKVNEHCNKRHNSWISDLKKTYLKNPWKILSLLGAIILLILTFIETVFSILE